MAAARKTASKKAEPLMRFQRAGKALCAHADRVHHWLEHLNDFSPDFNKQARERSRLDDYGVPPWFPRVARYTAAIGAIAGSAVGGYYGLVTPPQEDSGPIFHMLVSTSTGATFGSLGLYLTTGMVPRAAAIYGATVEGIGKALQGPVRSPRQAKSHAKNNAALNRA